MDPDEVRLQVTEVIRHEDFQWLTYHSPILGNNNGHPSGLSLFENDIAVLKVNGTLPCQKRVIWPACLPTPVRHQVPSGVTFDNRIQSLLAGPGQG